MSLEYISSFDIIESSDEQWKTRNCQGRVLRNKAEPKTIFESLYPEEAKAEREKNLKAATNTLKSYSYSKKVVDDIFKL